MGHAILERARLFGAQSADYITASGHSGRIAIEASLQAKTGRIHDRTRTFRSTVRFLLHRGHRPYMTRSNTRRGEFAALQKSPFDSAAMHSLAWRSKMALRVDPTASF
jgi:hypothetical protein